MQATVRPSPLEAATTHARESQRRANFSGQQATARGWRRISGFAADGRRVHQRRRLMIARPYRTAPRTGFLLLIVSDPLTVRQRPLRARPTSGEFELWSSSSSARRAGFGDAAKDRGDARGDTGPIVDQRRGGQGHRVRLAGFRCRRSACACGRDRRSYPVPRKPGLGARFRNCVQTVAPRRVGIGRVDYGAACALAFCGAAQQQARQHVAKPLSRSEPELSCARRLS